MKKYLVFTPDYARYGDGYYEPHEYGADVVEIEAETKRDAVIMGVKYMLEKGYQYVSDQRSDCRSPFEGVKAEEYGPEQECK